MGGGKKRNQGKCFGKKGRTMGSRKSTEKTLKSTGKDKFTQIYAEKNADLR